MTRAGEIATLTIEKPAAGGRMIARSGGQIVLVSGVIPGEQARVRIERIGKGVAYGRAVSIETPSPDRRDEMGDPSCGGCLYSYIAYPRQLEIKAQVIADAFLRIARVPWASRVEVAASPEAGYRMRARLHVRGGTVGFFREGSHQVCDARATRQLLSASSDILEAAGASIGALGFAGEGEIELSENVDASERVLHFAGAVTEDPSLIGGLAGTVGLTGLTMAEASRRGQVRAVVLAGDPRVADVLAIDDRSVTLRRHVLAFFQGNRFLLAALASHVVGLLADGESVVDLYAGTGLFSIAACVVKQATVTAVEGDPISFEDLTLNAAPLGGGVTPVNASVESFTARTHQPPGTLIVDPPRTGLSKDALDGVLRLRAAQVIYVSCDVATLARDARRLIDAGYALARLDGFDLFPNTPHVETVAVFRRP
jgi:23S rRNA (uracil1939-C5)-methyltransferase